MRPRGGEDLQKTFVGEMQFHRSGVLTALPLQSVVDWKRDRETTPSDQTNNKQYKKPNTPLREERSVHGLDF